MLDSGGIGSAVMVLKSPLMDSLRAQETELIRQARRHEIGVRRKSPADDQRARATERARQDAGRGAPHHRDLENEVSVATAREKELQSNMARLQDESARSISPARVSALQGEVNTNRQLFETFLVRFREIVEQQGLQESDAKILSAANPPNNLRIPRSCC